MEGIAEWWILEQRVMQVVGNLESVLNHLVERGFLLSLRNGDGRFCYRLNQEAEREIRDLLRNAGSRTPV